jgi:hypothetical protein
MMLDPSHRRSSTANDGVGFEGFTRLSQGQGATLKRSGEYFVQLDPGRGSGLRAINQRRPNHLLGVGGQ